MSPRLPRHLTIRALLGYVGVVGLTALLIAYVAFQARFIIAGPRVEIYTPDGVSDERTVKLEGQAKNIVSIELNGRVIYTDERGYFKETVVLENGYTIATVRAKDRYGRTTTLNRSFVYTPLTDNRDNIYGEESSTEENS
jgi:hypothetical protein